MLPGSRFPRVREPITKSCVPLMIGSTNAGIKRGTSLPSPSRKTIRHRIHRKLPPRPPHRRDRTRVAAETTRAPAFLARSAVWSVLPLSTTMTSRGSPRRDHFAHYLANRLFFIERWNDNGNPHGENLMRFRRRIVPEEPPATNPGACSAATRPRGRARYKTHCL